MSPNKHQSIKKCPKKITKYTNEQTVLKNKEVKYYKITKKCKNILIFTLIKQKSSQIDERTPQSLY